jgi:tetratricopeptide (TPR) repeat protein
MRIFGLPLVFLCALALAGCAGEPVQPQAADTAAPSVPHPRGMAQAQEQSQVLPKLELTPQIMFKLLLAEIALQRDQQTVAVESYLELARETKDPRIAQRAAVVAWNAHDSEMALEATNIWLQADPDSTQARQVLATLLIGQSQLADARPQVEKLLAADPPNAGGVFLWLNMLLARYPDKSVALQFVQELAVPYPGVPEAHYSVGRAAWNAENNELALAEVRAALKLRPDWEQAALFQGQVLQRSSDAAALTYFQEYLAAYPRAMDVRLSYARLLVNAQKFDEARTEFQKLLQEFPDNPEVSMAVALLSLQLRDYDAAETQLKHVLDTDYRDPDTVRFYLGQLDEERKRYDEALQWYASVEGGDQYVPARARYASVLAKQGKLLEARKYLHELQAKAQSQEQRVQLVQAEAQLLREANQYGEAYAVLDRALQKTPDSAELLYDHAMMAEKLDHIDVLEANLRKLIQIKPDYAHAYNALGYTLADRNTRLPEAYSLIEQALKLAPDDPFIIDSMGWVLYRMGKNDASLDFLKRAFDLRPDPEIAAHLGEVLWSAGQRDEARKIWNTALRDDPDNDVLLATVKKFAP